MTGRLIVIEGLDGCGKQTQTEILKKKLISTGKSTASVAFPDYDSDASMPVKMYLNGEFGEKALEVSPYMASVFYAVDRIASYKKNWQKLLEKGTIVLADRYTTSNMIHQGSKLSGKELDRYLEWLADFEYGKLSLPKPDAVIYLDMPPEFSAKLRKERECKFAGNDIHESDMEYLKRCAVTAEYVAEKQGWKTVKCVENDKIRTIDDIADEIFTYIKDLL